jgi:mono/diheme cytochrome c family protein
VRRRMNDGGRTEMQPARRKRHLSPEGRAAIAAAARRRWAKARRARRTSER